MAMKRNLERPDTVIQNAAQDAAIRVIPARNTGTVPLIQRTLKNSPVRIESPSGTSFSVMQLMQLPICSNPQSLGTSASHQRRYDDRSILRKGAPRS